MHGTNMKITNLLLPKLVLIFKEKPLFFKKETERERESEHSFLESV